MEYKSYVVSSVLGEFILAGIVKRYIFVKYFSLGYSFNSSYYIKHSAFAASAGSKYYNKLAFINIKGDIA